MTYTDLQTRAALLASFDGWSNAIPAPDWPTLVNEAWRRFSWEAELFTATVNVSTASGQSAYPLSPFMKRVLDLTCGGVPLRKSSVEFERFLSPGWRTVQGTPLRFVQDSTSSVAIVPVPSSTLALAVVGVIEGSNMTATTDQPGQVGGVGTPIPSNLHEAIALKAAYMQGQIAMQGESSSRMQMYEQEYAGFVNRCLAANGRLEQSDAAAA